MCAHDGVAHDVAAKPQPTRQSCIASPRLARSRGPAFAKPRHVAYNLVLSNEKADAAAKSALSLPVSHMKLPVAGMYPRITKLIFDEWQEVWNCCAGNKLHAIRLTVGDYKQKTYLSCRDTVLQYC